MFAYKRLKYLMFSLGVGTERPASAPMDLAIYRTQRRRFSYVIALLILGALLGGAAFIRFWAAPLSAGVDVPQFWAFAKVFEMHGLDFYRFAGAELDIFPVKGWGFVYPPVWLLVLRLALAFTPMSTAAAGMVDSSWRLAMKTPLIAADLAIGCLLYWAVPGAKWKKLLFAGLWLFHPASWYNSAIFGQFDVIAAALLLAAVILLQRGNDKAAFLIAGLAVMTKQHVLIPVLFMLALSYKSLGRRRILIDCGIMAGVAVALSIPFLVTGNFLEYGRSLILPGQTPGYQTPLMYAFSGSGALLTYLHDVLGWETGSYLYLNIPVLVFAITAGLFFAFRGNITPAQGALIGFLLFIGINYRVNYQYLVIFIPLALLVAAQSRYKGEKAFTIIMAALPAAWLWLFNVSFWFFHLEPEYFNAVEIMERLALTHNDIPDYGYVILSVTLMCLFLAYVILAFTIWRKRPVMLKRLWQQDKSKVKT